MPTAKFWLLMFSPFRTAKYVYRLEPLLYDRPFLSNDDSSYLVSLLLILIFPIAGLVCKWFDLFDDSAEVSAQL